MALTSMAKPAISKTFILTFSCKLLVLSCKGKLGMDFKYSDFKKLLVWQKSIKFVKNIYRFTHTLPEDEKFNLISQIKRAVISIPSNISEGQCRDTNKEFLHFLSIARGSSGEIETQLIICDILDFGNKDEINFYYKKLEKLMQC